jgi:hypothetical protein
LGENALIERARQYQQKVFSETSKRPDGIAKVPGKRDGRRVNTFGEALVAVTKGATSVAANPQLKAPEQTDSERVVGLARVLQHKVFAERGISVGADGNGLGDALKAISFGDAATIPSSTIQKVRDARNDGSVFQSPQPEWKWDPKLGWVPLGRPVDAVKARLLGQQEVKDLPLMTYAETKQHTLGKPAVAQPTHAEARAAALGLGEQLKASEGAPKVVMDNADVVAAVEAYMAERFAKFGEKVPLKAAILKVSRRRR